MSVNLGRLFSTDPLHSQFFDFNRENINAYLSSIQDKIKEYLKSRKDQLQDESSTAALRKNFIISLRETKEIEKWIHFSTETDKFKFNIEAAVMDLFEKILKETL